MPRHNNFFITKTLFQKDGEKRFADKNDGKASLVKTCGISKKIHSGRGARSCGVILAQFGEKVQARRQKAKTGIGDQGSEVRQKVKTYFLPVIVTKKGQSKPDPFLEERRML
ncbi:MAG: hypothetical protein LBG61_05095, partial [Burkholderiales bacterium]|nr:hypothetical protein [Burkholderiales bacterium]